jgi:hypothetical protein
MILRTEGISSPFFLTQIEKFTPLKSLYHREFSSKNISLYRTLGCLIG